MRLPNKTGSVHKLSGHRRKPWRARVTIGWDIGDNGKARQIYKDLGTFATRKEALEVLALYNAGISIDEPKHRDGQTFAEIYNLWSAEHFEKISQNSQDSYRYTFNILQDIHSVPIKDFNTFLVDETLASIDKKGMRALAKTLLTQVLGYAERHELIEKNYAKLSSVSISTDPEIVRLPFSVEEIHQIGSQDGIIRDMILFNIYTGLRPVELINIEIEKIDLQNYTLTGGVKTKAGRNRVVPIHPAIRDILCKYIGSRTAGHLFLNKRTKRPFTSLAYRKYFYSFMESLDMKHYPHDCRHTFVTLGKSYEMDEYVLKRITGHTINDITEATYTHRNIEQLHNEILKIPNLI